MSISLSSPISISNELEIQTPTPLQHAEMNNLWSTALAKESWETYTSAEQLEVWTFKPKKGLGLTGIPVDELLTQLFPALTNRNKKATTQAFQCLLLAAYQVLRQPQEPNRLYGFLQGTNTAHKKQAKRYSKSAFSSTVLGKGLKMLADNGYLDGHRGFKGQSYYKGLTSLWTPTRQFYSWLEENHEHLSVVTFIPDTETVHLKAKEARIDYIDTPETDAMRGRINASNRLRAAHKWTYHALEDQHQFSEGLEQTLLHNDDLICRRVFNDTFNRGGRFYCGVQRLKKGERATIQIDGEPTVELDFKSMHPRMAYHKLGLEAPVDCYSSDNMDRKIAKMVSLISLNAENRTSAVRAIGSKLGISVVEASNYANLFMEDHYPIRDWFFSSAWAELQYLESQITDQALKEATEIGIPVLPIHDSYITKTRHVFKMRDILLEVYRKCLGFDPELAWED